MSKKPEPQLECHGIERFMVRWNDKDGCRYHVWINRGRQICQIDLDMIFKNPPVGVQRPDLRYFDTRRLKVSSKKWEWLRDHIASIPGSAFAEASRAYVAEQDAKERKRAEEARQHDLQTMRELAQRYGFVCTPKAHALLAERENQS